MRATIKGGRLRMVGIQLIGIVRACTGINSPLHLICLMDCLWKAVAWAGTLLLLCRCVRCMWPRRLVPASWRAEARSSPSTSWLWRPPRDRRLFSSKVNFTAVVNICQSSRPLNVLCSFSLSGPRKNREACKHFGPAPGVPHSHTKWVALIVSLLPICNQLLNFVIAYILPVALWLHDVLCLISGLTFVPRDASSNVLVVGGPAVVTRSKSSFSCDVSTHTKCNKKSSHLRGSWFVFAGISLYAVDWN